MLTDLTTGSQMIQLVCLSVGWLVSDNQNPEWRKSFNIEYFFEEHQGTHH
jgi:hypothetical protein